MSNSFTEYEKRHILSILGSTSDLMNISYVKIFSAQKDFKGWLYSDLEGFLCYVVDYKVQAAYLRLYGFGTYQKLFQLEQYQNFNSYYTKLSNDFHCFELDQSFIGIQFSKTDEANAFYNLISKFTDKHLENLYKNYSKKQIDKSKLETNLKCLKERLQKEKTFFPIKTDFESYVEKYYGCGLDIYKPTSYSIILNFEYDPTKKVFKIKDLNKDMKRMLRYMGLKKKDLGNVELVLKFFKTLIEKCDKFQKKQKMIDLEMIESKRTLLFTNSVFYYFSLLGSKKQ